MSTSQPATEPVAVTVPTLHRACADEVAALAFDLRFPPPGSVPTPRAPLAEQIRTAS